MSDFLRHGWIPHVEATSEIVDEKMKCRGKELVYLCFSMGVSQINYSDVVSDPFSLRTLGQGLGQTEYLEMESCDPKKSCLWLFKRPLKVSGV